MQLGYLKSYPHPEEGHKASPEGAIGTGSRQGIPYFAPTIFHDPMRCSDAYVDSVTPSANGLNFGKFEAHILPDTQIPALPRKGLPELRLPKGLAEMKRRKSLELEKPTQ